ncbi:MAG: hypothetical protein MR574_00135, partial [Oscillospiraceae bacterium]|nr:hypothetical protein [Oscillospiraceae bacterium]
MRSPTLRIAPIHRACNAAQNSTIQQSKIPHRRYIMDYKNYNPRAAALAQARTLLTDAVKAAI